MINATTSARGPGRPRKANSLTPAQRSKRYRDKKRAEQQEAVTTLLAHLVREAAKPYDANAERRLQETFNDQCNQIDEEFRELMRWFDYSSSSNNPA